MATRKSGPVKPPTLDLEASKKTDTATEPKPAASANKSSSAKKPLSMPSINWQLPSVAAGGAIVGAVLAYLVAAFGLWPTPPQPVDDSGPAIAALERRLETIEAGDRNNAENTATLEQRITDIEVETLAQLGAANQSIEELRRDIANLPAPTGDNTALLNDVQNQQDALQSTLTTLNTRIEALAAGADPAAANEIANTLATTNQTLADLRQSLTALENATNTQLSALSTRLDTTETRLTASAATRSETSQTLRLPLALSGVEAALNRGRPFAAELNALMASQPDTTISPALLSAANNGLPTPEKTTRDFAASIPDLLAAAPKNPDASWQDSLVDQAKSLLALRPTGAVSGNTPEALVARTEAALAIPDFAIASQNIEQMPQPMRDAIPDIAATIAAQAEARQFLTDLRAAALAESVAQ